MRRREVLALTAGAATARPAAAQQAKVPTIGVLFGGSAALLNAAFPAAFFAGLSEFGYHDGQNIAVEYRTAEGRYERLPALASDLVGRKADVIVAAASPPSLAAKAPTSTIPIVFGIAPDPVV